MNRPRRNRALSLRGGLAALATVASLAFAGVALAQVSGSFDLSWSLLPPGGGTSASQDHELVSTLGQTSAMTSESESYRMDSGFLAGLVALEPTDDPEPTVSDAWVIH